MLIIFGLSLLADMAQAPCASQAQKRHFQEPSHFDWAILQGADYAKLELTWI